MVFFRKKTSLEEKPSQPQKVEEIPKPVTETKTKAEEIMPQHKEEHVKEEEYQQEEKREGIPLFVKLDKYQTVLSLVNELKATIFMMKNALAVQKKLEELTHENIAIMADALGKLEERVVAMDAEFTKPPGYEEEYVEMGEDQNIEYAISDLKQKLSDLKSDIKQMI